MSEMSERIAALEAKLAGELAVLDAPVHFEERIKALEARVAEPHERLLTLEVALAKRRSVNEGMLAAIFLFVMWFGLGLGVGLLIRSVSWR